MLGTIARTLGLKTDLAQANRTASKILKNNQYNAFDIGAAEWLLEHWEKLLHSLNFYAVEPDQNAAKKLLQRYSLPNYKVLPVGLSENGGEKEIFLFNVRTGSSLLPPLENLNEYSDRDYIYPITKEKIPTVSFRDLVKQNGGIQPHLIKLDTQGTELDIVKGLTPEQLMAVQGLEIEIGMPGNYQNQPQLAEYISYLGQFGFELYDLRPSKTYLKRNNPGAKYQRDLFGVCDNSPTLSSKIWEVDAIFLKKREYVLKQDENFIRRMLITYSIYNYFLEAYSLIEELESNKALSTAVCNELKADILELHRSKEVKSIYRNTGFFNALRKFLFKISPKNSPRWHNFTYQNYP